MDCPKCHSHNAQLCSMAHEQGTSTAIISGAVGGRADAVSGLSRTTTPFAQRAAPPQNAFKPWPKRLILSGIALAITFIVQSNQPANHDWFGIFYFVTVPWFLISLVGFARTYPSRKKYDADKTRWEKSWICAACGNIFVPETAAE